MLAWYLIYMQLQRICSFKFICFCLVNILGMWRMCRLFFDPWLPGKTGGCCHFVWNFVLFGRPVEIMSLVFTWRVLSVYVQSTDNAPKYRHQSTWYKYETILDQWICSLYFVLFWFVLVCCLAAMMNKVDLLGMIGRLCYNNDMAAYGHNINESDMAQSLGYLIFTVEDTWSSSLLIGEYAVSLVWSIERM